MKRACFLLQVNEDLVEEYREAHDVWPEMLAALSDLLRHACIWFDVMT